MREFLEKPAGKAMAISLVVAALVFAGWMYYANQSSGVAAAITADQMFVDASTGKPFSYTLKRGDTFPITSPSGGKTGYIAELCYWTKDGKAKSTPTPVLLNASVGKAGPTFCPDCGRLVIGRNPPPVGGAKAPPTKEEYESTHKAETE